MISVIALTKNKKNHLLSIAFFLKEKESIFSVMGRAKLPISIYFASKEEMEVLMPIREIGLSWVDPVPRNILTHYKSI